MNKEQLVKKFENDVKKRSYILRLLLVIDQLFNVVIWNGSQDETISSHIGRKIEKGTANWFDKSVCKLLSCIKSKGE